MKYVISFLKPNRWKVLLFFFIIIISYDLTSPRLSTTDFWLVFFNIQLAVGPLVAYWHVLTYYELGFPDFTKDSQTLRTIYIFLSVGTIAYLNAILDYYFLKFIRFIKIIKFILGILKHFLTNFKSNFIN